MVNIAIEIGTTYTTIFVENYNVVLREPSVVAFMDDDYNTVRAVGKQALELDGKINEKVNFVYPVCDGYVKDASAASIMLKEFIKKIFPRAGKLFGPCFRAILSVPASLTVEERRMYEDVCVKAGIRKVEMVDKVVLSAVGASVPVSDGGVILVSVGGGSTEVALVSVYSIIDGLSINVGGTMMDSAIVDCVRGKYGLKISKAIATKIKEEIGSLYTNDLSKLDVKGLDSGTLTPAEITVYATDVYEVLLPYYECIASGVMQIINNCPPALAEYIHDRGVFVVGGGAKIPGLKEYLLASTKLPVTICKDPEYASIIGAGKLMTDKEMLELINEN